MNIILSSGSPDPIYQQIVQQIQTAIFKGELQEGTSLPSIRSLAKDLKVSVITTKRAYEELERAGLITTVAGKGSFVSNANHDALLEKRKYLLEEALETIVRDAKHLSMSEDELVETVRWYYQNN